MSNNSVVVDKYAKAAFEIAKKSNLEDIFLNDLSNFYQNISESLRELSNPAISKGELKNIIIDLTQKLKINDVLSSFLIVLAQSRRINLIEKIYEKLEALVKKDKNILQVELISASELKSDQLTQVKNLLKTKYPNNQIEIQESIKKDLLGGIVIRIGSFVIDTSVKSQLSEIYSDCISII